MVGLVLVSHSHTLAVAAKELALGVNEGASLPIAACGGVGENHEELGTDATEILEALESVASPEGVVLLMDLGSAVLSAEMALELFEQEIPVRLCPAPLVEGAVAAAVQISMEADLETVCREALAALDPKQEQIAPASGADGAAPEGEGEGPGQVGSVDASTPMVERRFTIRTPHGLHARPAAQFVRAVGAAGVAAEAAHGDRPERWVNARSLNKVATLQVRSGEDVVVRAPAGGAADELFRQLTVLVARNFGESPAAPEADLPPQESAQSGEELISLSPGVVVAPVFILGRELPEIPSTTVDDPEAEARRLTEAISTAAQQIESARRETIARGAASEAEIFDAHILILEDPEFLSETQSRIRTKKLNALAAVDEVSRESADAYRALEDPYMRGRASDVEEVARRLLLTLAGGDAPRATRPEKPSIIVAEELGPAETISLPPDLVAGFLTRRGDRTSHAAILARALGVPAVTGYRQVEELKEGMIVALDAGAPEVIVDPDAGERRRMEAAERQWRDERERERREAAQGGATKDGKPVPVYANIGGPGEMRGALDNGAEGVGLFRTEFLFLGRPEAPTEDEQEEIFRQVLEGGDGRPVILRLLDIGGDKQISYLALPREENPFLGVRGVRLYPSISRVYESHLRAVLRAGASGDLRVMIPMVTTPAEVEEVRSDLLEAHRGLRGEDRAHIPTPQVGVMIETPAAVELASELGEVSDFFSLGTNDLTQYIMAADRGNQGVAKLQDGLNPAVLRAISRVTGAAAAAGIPCGVCGELAADPEGAMILTGLGASSLSCSPSAIPGIKKTLRRFTSNELRLLAQRCLEERDGTAVRQRCANLLEGAG